MVVAHHLSRMKTDYDTQRAADAALKQAGRKSCELTSALAELRMHPEQFAQMMPKVRAILAELTQRVHEFNAYNNVVRGV